MSLPKRELGRELPSPLTVHFYLEQGSPAPSHLSAPHSLLPGEGDWSHSRAQRGNWARPSTRRISPSLGGAATAPPATVYTQEALRWCFIQAHLPTGLKLCFTINLI